MRRYKCYKEVNAGKIIEIDPSTSMGDLKVETRPGLNVWMDVGIEFFPKHSPQVGGYFVEYEDGYQSYSPADVFESGYTLIEEEPDAS